MSTKGIRFRIGAARRAIALVLWGLVIVLGASFVGAGETRGQTPNHASLSVDFGNGRVEHYCITFEEESISGAELLDRSGLSVLYSGFGGLGSAVCRIDNTGCSDPGDCWCQCRGADCHYWTYFSANDGEWRYQNIGPSQRTVHDGDADAWLWGNGHDRPQSSAAGVCAAPTSTPTPPLQAATEPPAQQPAATQAGPRSNGSQQGRAVRETPTNVAPESPLSAAEASPGATPAATSEVRAESRQREPDASGAQRSDEDGGSSPTGLIAFGAVAAALVAGVGGLLAWRRARG